MGIATVTEQQVLDDLKNLCGIAASVAQLYETNSDEEKAIRDFDAQFENYTNSFEACFGPRGGGRDWNPGDIEFDLDAVKNNAYCAVDSIRLIVTAQKSPDETLTDNHKQELEFLYKTQLQTMESRLGDICDTYHATTS